MKLSLGFSPCPNDTFIFDALVNKKIDTEGLNFEVLLEDVEALNQMALQGSLDITKLSFPAFFQSLDKYVLLNSGGAFGNGVGPVLVARSEIRIPDIESENWELKKTVVALPGENTTANLLFSFACPGTLKKKFMLFSDIEDSVLNAESDLGVIIHENRFTYQKKGLHKLIDLGEYWQQKMNAPVPLGGIVIKKSVERQISLKVDRLIKKSIEYAFAKYPAISDYVKQHSQTMSEDVMRQHIDLYVNKYSLDLDDESRKAVNMLHQVFLSIYKKPMTVKSELFL